MRKTPLRKCIVSNKQYDKRELTRIVKTKDGLVFVDTTGKANGRGAYLYLSLANIKKAKSTNILSKVLETEVPDSIYEQLEELYERKNS